MKGHGGTCCPRLEQCPGGRKKQLQEWLHLPFQVVFDGHTPTQPLLPPCFPSRCLCSPGKTRGPDTEQEQQWGFARSQTMAAFTWAQPLQ